MAEPVYSRPYGKRFLGNKNEKEVHDLHAEKGPCHVDAVVRAGHAVVFTPDTLAQARMEGYDNCHWCLGASIR